MEIGNKINNITRLTRLIVSILACQAAGMVGSIFTVQSIPAWYASLQKPWFSPPNWLFAPAWLSFYTLMGISLYIVWSRGLKKKTVRAAIKIFAVQLVLNSLWSILFFGLQSPLYALMEIVVLWCAILYTIVKFYKISRNAGLILLPYLLWVSFAAVLNFSVWMPNP
jgi:tryptophan-rich sensory protein